MKPLARLTHRSVLTHCVYWAAVLVVTAAGLGAVSVGPGSPVAQAAGEVNKHFHFSVSPPPDVLCVGRSYPLTATMLVDFDRPGNPQRYEDRVVSGVSVAASTDDARVAAITPAKLNSGVLSTDLGGSVAIGTIPGLGQVQFTLQAKKAGTANIQLVATIPGSLTGAAAGGVTSVVPIQVKNCHYQVNVDGLWTAHYDNLTTILIENLQGELVLQDSGQFSGDANIFWSVASYSAMCQHTHTTSPGQATLTAHENGDNLDVTIAYQAFELDTANCASSSKGQIPVQTISLHGVPSTGLSTGTTLPFPIGNEVLYGTGTITIRPIAGQ